MVTLVEEQKEALLEEVVEKPKHQVAKAALQFTMTAIQLGILAWNIEQSVEEKKNPITWFFYLTHLSLLLNAFIESGLAVRATQFLSSNRNLSELKNESKIGGVDLLDLTAVVSGAATSLYWGADRSGDLSKAAIVHGVNTAALATHYLLTQKSFFKELFTINYVPPVLFAMCYVVSNAIFTLNGGTNEQGKPLYDVLDWEKNPDKAILWSLIGIAFFAAIPALAYGLNSFADKIKKSCNRENEGLLNNQLLGEESSIPKIAGTRNSVFSLPETIIDRPDQIHPFSSQYFNMIPTRR